MIYIIAFAYQMLGLFDIVPPVNQDMVVQLTMIVLQLALGFGIVVDPTTEGISDSDRAMTYDRPNPVIRESPPEYTGKH